VNSDLIIVFLLSYICGSIPFGLIVTKIFLQEDVRKIGSGNIGATNVLRTGKKSLAALTLLLDASKGFFSVYLTLFYFNDLVYLAALMCFVGHIYPIWLKFKGGKGVATYLGIVLALSFKFAIIFILTWLVVLYFFRYSSLSSILSAFTVLMYSFYLNNFSLYLYLFMAFIIILYTHRENILRLKNKEESKIKL
jgi:glycerol-3-phosphate acyltransferase PlsY